MVFGYTFLHIIIMDYYGKLKGLKGKNSDRPHPLLNYLIRKF